MSTRIATRPVDTLAKQPIHYVPVIHLVEKVANIISHHGAHVLDPLQGFQLGVHQCMDITKILRQGLGRCLAYFANTQRINKPRQGRVL